MNTSEANKAEEPFRPLILNNRTVFWYTVAGYAENVRRYTQTHSIPGTDNVPATTYRQQVTEFWITDKTGKQTPIMLPFDLMLAEGQRVSAVYSGIDGSRKSAWLVLVNHDAQSSHYLDSPRGFFRKAGVFKLVPRWVPFLLLIVGLFTYIYVWGHDPAVQGAAIKALWTFSLWPWMLLCSTPALLVGAVVVWQSGRIRKAWKEVEAHVAGMVGYQLSMTEHMDWIG